MPGHGNQLHQMMNTSGHTTQTANQQPIEVINKTGNTVYINGLSSGTNLLKKASIDMSGKDL